MSDPLTPAAARTENGLPFVEEIVPAPDPVHCAELVGGLDYRLFLDSAATGPALGRYSFLTADPVAVVRSKGPKAEWLDRFRGQAWRNLDTDALEAARELLAPSCEPVRGLPPFQGGVAGYFAYEWGQVLEGRLPPPGCDDLLLPDVVLGLYDWVLAWDHCARDAETGEDTTRAWLISTGIPEVFGDARGHRAARRAAEVLERLAGIPGSQSPLAQAPDHAGPGNCRPRSYPVQTGGWNPRIQLCSSFTHAAYLDAVARVREYILAGDVFQANLSQRFEAPLNESPWSFYRRLREANAAPFAAYFDSPGFALLSASPERFVSVDERGRVQTRPIKGTRPRGVGPEHDAALGQALTESAKDRAENLMIVDLMRNDLSAVCEPGTVRVEELFALERYASVHHLVSTVTGQLVAGTDPGDLLRAAFPGGSITGAPKVRAMEIITELEPFARGAYCGAIGYWSVTGALDMNIAIRTAVWQDGRLYFNAGGGIVVDSDPEREYRETLDKARGIIDALIP